MAVSGCSVLSGPVWLTVDLSADVGCSILCAFRRSLQFPFMSIIPVLCPGALVFPSSELEVKVEARVPTSDG
jgi:hypothetical protein